MIFLQPTSIPELTEALGQLSGENCHLLAGCTDFLAQRNGKHWDADVLVSLVNVPELKQITEEDGALSIGAACTHTQIEEHPLAAQYFPALTAACGNVGSKQIRNRGTIGGSIGNASPAGDMFPVLLLLDAQARILNSAGEIRELPLSQLVLGIGSTALAADEAILSFRIPLPCPCSRNVFAKLGERAKVTIAKINLAVALCVEDGMIRSAKVVLGAVAERAFFSEAAAAALEGKPLDGSLLPGFSAALSEEIRRSIPNRASMPYKSEAVAGLADDVLQLLLQQ